MSDAVVVLSGDASGDRLDKAIGVLLATGSPRLVVDPSGPNAVYRGRAELLRYIASSGVPAESVRLLDPTSTPRVRRACWPGSPTGAGGGR